MARINPQEFTCIKRNNKLHNYVRATYTVLDLSEKVIQINTYGMTTRQEKDQVSQTIQIDKDTARILMELFKREFDL